MVHDIATQWVLTLIFVAVGAYSAVRTAASGDWTNRVSQATHVLMSAAMVAMTWSWGARIPTAASVATFAAAALWYAALAVFRPATAAGPGETGHHGGPLLLWYHAGMMATMVWMAVLMSRMGMGSSLSGMAAAPETSGTGMPGNGMPGNGMPGNGMPGMGVWQQPGWSVALTVMSVTLFLVAGAWFLLRLLRTRRAHGHEGRSQRADTLASLLMAAGMAGSFLAMS